MVAIVDTLCYSVSVRQSAALPTVCMYYYRRKLYHDFSGTTYTLRKQQGLSQEQLGYELGVTARLSQNGNLELPHLKWIS